MSTQFGVHFNQHWVSRELSPLPTYEQNQALMYPVLKAMGGTVARIHGLWSDYQDKPAIPFDPAARSFDDAAYAQYLASRGFGADGEKLALVFDALHGGQKLGLHSLFNLGGIPEWAQTVPASLRLKDAATPGEFLHDFIVYCARQPNGADVLDSIDGIQLFNEVNGGARAFQPGYGHRADQIPHDDYFSIVDHALLLTKMAGEHAPPLVAPNLGGAYSPGFWDALSRYVPQHAASTNASGHLDITAAALHPYGVSVRPDVDPVGTDTSSTPNIDAWHLRENLTFRRYMLPTDDRLTMAALIARDPALSAQWKLAPYAGQGNPADEYLDRNAEMGVERSAAKLTQMGYVHITLHLSEFGGTSYPGGALEPGDDPMLSLWDTLFADPSKYGHTPMDGVLPQAVANNLQAEAITQMAGLIEEWDFVSTATAYQLYDYEGLSSEAMFGLASAASPSSAPILKPAGAAYQAFLGGQAYSAVDLSGAADNLGVDLHIAAMGSAGPFAPATRDAAAHEVVLLRDGDDEFSSGAGDDIVFGGTGADMVDGGKGNDRLYGGQGADRVTGGAGDDRVKGGPGDDVMTGGKGNDQFVFVAHALGESGNHGHDTITDFSPALKGLPADRIVLIGGYRAEDLLDNMLHPQLVQDTADGVRITYADNGATILLHGVHEAQLSAADFHVLDADMSVMPSF